MNDPKKLSIRINFVSQQDKVAEQAAKEESGYIYHWHRIIAASLLSITTVGTLVYGGFNYFNQEHNHALVLAALASANAAPLEKQQNITTQSPDIVSEKSSAESLGKSTVQTQVNNDAGISPVPLNQENNIEHAAENDTSAVKAKLKVNTKPPLFRQSERKIFSEQVQRFLIAKNVQKKEPLGGINDIGFDVNNIATVYAYSHVVGLKGETLYYKWTRNGNKIAQVKVRVGADSWRSYSRKYIQPHMRGKWRITLENKKGEILAVNRFNY